MFRSLHEIDISLELKLTICFASKMKLHVSKPTTADSKKCFFLVCVQELVVPRNSEIKGHEKAAANYAKVNRNCQVIPHYDESE